MTGPELDQLGELAAENRALREQLRNALDMVTRAARLTDALQAEIVRERDAAKARIELLERTLLERSSTVDDLEAKIADLIHLRPTARRTAGELWKARRP